MKLAMLIGRLVLAAVFLLCFVIILLFCVVLALGYTGKDRHMAPAIGLFVFQIAFSCAPSIFIATLTSTDTKKTRLSAAVKAMAVVSSISVLWNYFMGPWVGQNLLIGLNSPFQVGLALDAFVGNLLLFISALLTAYWLPSLKSRAQGKPPKAVKHFEIIMFASLGMYFFNAALNYKSILEQASSYTSTNPALNAVGSGPFVIAVFASVFIILFYLTIRISRYGSIAAREIMLVFFLVGIVFSIPSVAASMRGNVLSITFASAAIIIQAYALYLLYSSECDDWFKGRVSEETL